MMGDPGLSSASRLPATAVLNFDQAAVDAWAAFSGDYNPVHFDLEHAQAAGLGGLIVHGMLALLPVKQALSRSLGATQPSSEPWIKFRAVFRNPIPCGKESLLSLRGHGPKLEFRVRATEFEQEQFRGSLARIAAPRDETGTPGQAEALDRAGLAQRIRKLATVLPGLEECWIALDAIVFAEFVRRKIGDIEAQVVPMLKASSDGRAHGAAVYQLSHAVSFRGDLLHRLPSELEQLQPLTYRLPASVDATYANGQAVGTIEVPVFDASGLLMSVEIGLMAKTVND